MKRLPWWADGALVDGANQFARNYAERSGITVAELALGGRFPEPCTCSFGSCAGWAMGFQWEDAILMEAGRNLLEAQRRLKAASSELRAAVAGQ